jgi:hemoglobin
MPFFHALVDRFYDEASADPDLLALYPEPMDPAPARRRPALFLAEYWGGPPVYSEERGHPRLRMRHASFPIGEPERDAWLSHMRAALEDLLRPRTSPGRSASTSRWARRRYATDDARR